MRFLALFEFCLARSSILSTEYQPKEFVPIRHAERIAKAISVDIFAGF